MSTYKILGSSDHGECELCGKKGLKRTVAICTVDADGQQTTSEEHWGVCCAALAMFGSKSAKNQNKVQRELERLEQERIQAERSRQMDEKVKLGRISQDGDRNNANRFYHRSGRSVQGSYFAKNEAGAVVRVDGKDAKDVQFFAGRGFEQFTEAVA